MLRKAREDGISKKNKLKTKSIRSRIAAIPSRCSEERKVANMQIRGSASRRADGEGSERKAGSRVPGRSTSRIRTSPQREDRVSYSGRSNSSIATPRKETSTKASLGNHYPPLLPSNVSDHSSLPPAQVASPTDTPGPRSSTPSHSQQASTSSQLVPSPTQINEHISVASSSASPDCTTQREMGSILSAATVRVLDPFDDDEDDDAMRRLCASPVLHPDNSTSTSLMAAANAPTSLRITETQTLALSEPSHRPLQNYKATGQGDDIGKPRVVRGYEVNVEASDRAIKEAAVPNGSPASPNQHVYFKADVPNSKHGSAKNAFRHGHEASINPKGVAVSSFETSNGAALSTSAEGASAPATGKANRPVTLEDRIRAIEEALATAQLSANKAQGSHVTSTGQSSASHTTSGSASRHSRTPDQGKKQTFEDRIAFLEALVFKAEHPTPQTTISPSTPPVPKASPPALSASHPQPQPAAIAPQTSHSGLPTRPEPVVAQRDYAPPTTERRQSSASSDSYEPASPAHTASSEFADFGPGEFVLSTEALEAHAASFIAPIVPAAVSSADEAARTAKLSAIEAAAEPESEDDEDAPYFPPSRIQLPPNQDIPPLYNHGAVKRPSPRNEPTRAYASSAHLRHPTPRLGTVAPTASMLEESADRRSAKPVEVDSSVEYEDQPIDIAARSVKPRRQSTTKVKFADAEDEAKQDKSGDQESKEPVTLSISKESSVVDVTSEKGSPTIIAGAPKDQSITATQEPVAEFEFEETDILKGITMPSLARSNSDSSSDGSDSETQPESPAENFRPTSMSNGKQAALKKDGVNGLPSPAKVSKATSALTNLKASKRPSSAASSRSSSPSGHSDISNSSESEAEKDKVSAAAKVSAPPIRWGGSLMKKEGRKAGFNQPRPMQRYGVHSGYSGPPRTFRSFEYPSGPSGWRGSAAVESTLPAVHPETAYDVAQEQGGNVALASFIEDYEPAIVAAEMSSRADLHDALPATLLPAKKNISIRGASSRAKEKKREKNPDKTELDIFDELLASI